MNSRGVSACVGIGVVLMMGACAPKDGHDMARGTAGVAAPSGEAAPPPTFAADSSRAAEIRTLYGVLRCVPSAAKNDRTAFLDSGEAGPGVFMYLDVYMPPEWDAMHLAVRPVDGASGEAWAAWCNRTVEIVGEVVRRGKGITEEDLQESVFPAPTSGEMVAERVRESEIPLGSVETEVRRLRGRVRERPWTKTGESWEAGGSTYYVLEFEPGAFAVRPWASSVVLRVESAGERTRLQQHVGEQVEVVGRFSLGKPFTPHPHESHPLPLPRRRGEGLVVEEIRVVE